MTINHSNPNETTINSGRRNFIVGAAATAVGAGLAASITSQAQANTDNENQQDREFVGRCAFITGGARGIGYKTAEVLARSGANIVLYDIAKQIENVKYPLATAEDLANAKKEIEKLGVQCIAIQGDVRDGAHLKKAVQQAVSEFGSLDMMIANAGITQIGFLDKFTEEEVQLVLDVNLAGAIKSVQAAMPIMQKQKSGRIVLNASITGRAGSQYFPIYSASKWGMIGITKSTALAMGAYNVTCNAVCPSLVNTKLLNNDYILKTLSPQNPTLEAFNEGAKQRHIMPVGLYEPIHVANTIKFLCSDAATYISGDVFDIQAGINAQFPA